jgi:hypothetical protein
MRIVNSKKHNFSVRKIQKNVEPHALHYLSQRASFWIAALSVLAYVAGNMMGQYGWHTFWASVLGKTDDSLIVYTGTVTPIAAVPDYDRWARYGGNPQEHTYQQVPLDVLVPLPRYDSVEQSKTYDESPGDIYSMGHLSSYATGAEESGSHVGVDIRVPVGTPVRAIMNGIVERVEDNERGSGGMGKMIVLRHPNVPDPSDPRKATTLYSVYGHLSSVFVSEGTVVSKGEKIGHSGNSGFATGPHLHVQLDRETAPWHPYWPFTGEEQRAAGLTFVAAVDQGFQKSRGRLHTVNPLLYVQANYPPPRTAVATAGTPDSAPTLDQAVSMLSRSEARRIEREERLARVSSRRAVRLAIRENTVAVAHPAPAAPSSVAPATIVTRSTVVTASPEQAIASTTPLQLTVEISHDGSFVGRSWEEVRVRLIGGDGAPIRSPELSSDLHLRTAYGDADIRPAILTSLDFENGLAIVRVLPRGTRTVVIEVQPYGVLSRPMVYAGN